MIIGPVGPLYKLLPKASHPCFWILGVAFSPFEDPAVEQARLKDRHSIAG